MGTWHRRLQSGNLVLARCKVVYLAESFIGFAFSLVVTLTLIDIAAAESGDFNRRATATAQILAGMKPAASDPALDRLVKLEAFAEHQKWMTSQWAQARARISAIES
jgi:hypothetical protein